MMRVASQGLRLCTCWGTGRARRVPCGLFTAGKFFCKTAAAFFSGGAGSWENYMDFFENETRPERALLVELDTGEFDAQTSLDELHELVRSAGADPVLSVTQKRPSPETATCVGAGMMQEIASACGQNEIDLLVFDRELTPTQIRNIEEQSGVRTIDRTMLILDIFASRARTSEGKLQV